MSTPTKSRSRRAEIRKNRPDNARFDWQRLRESGTLASVGIAAGFCLAAMLILMLRPDVVPYRPDQSVPHDIVSRVDFRFSDHRRLADAQRLAREREPRVFRSNGDVWSALESKLLALPDRVANSVGQQLPADLANMLDEGAAGRLADYASNVGRRPAYISQVRAYVKGIQTYTLQDQEQRFRLFVLPTDQRRQDIEARRPVALAGEGSPIDPRNTFSVDDDQFKGLLDKQAATFIDFTLQPHIVGLTQAWLTPTHELDALATSESQNRAAGTVPSSAGSIFYPANAILVPRTDRVLSYDDWQLLRAEHQAYLATIPHRAWMSRLGLASLVAIITVVLCRYIAIYQPRILRNHARAVALGALLLSMLLLAQLTGIGTGPLYLFGIVPTILVAMVLTIAYDQRFAIGVASIHGLLVTLAVDQDVGFFVILWVGLLTACFLLDDIRTRSKLIEVGGATAIAMIVATAAAAAVSAEPMRYVFKNCLLVGGAGLAAGFIVLGILPFIEKAFRITTSMTLLELADASHPLLRRLAVEAPGTYAHSLQVATLAESAAEAVHANSLLCRVGAYYHDIGKINKADYFVENCGGRENRHLNLSPNVSLLIIIGHVKDGVELAKEYALPTVLINFIQQHHGTTLVEYFYHQACTQKDKREPDMPAISETQYRYPGPKPRTREVAIVMLADAVESASRALGDVTANRVETLVHDLAMKRLLDGQFDECDLTIRELEKIERSLIKTLLGMYHGRIAYPSTTQLLSTPPATLAVRTA